MMRTLDTLVLLAVMVGCWAIPSFTSQKEAEMGNRMLGANLTAPELIAALGYPVEVHHVVTEDGYILELHRIPHGVKSRPKKQGEAQRVAFLHHGMLGASTDFLINTPDEAIAYILADEGYDVWLANCRGNEYSRNHTSLNPDHKKFWQFTWDEMGLYDAPANIDYILATTGQDQLYYVSFSMGGTIYLTMLSEHPEYADKIKTAALMAPAAYMVGMRGFLAQLVPYAHDIDTILTALGYPEFLAGGEQWDKLIDDLCGDPNLSTSEICDDFLFIIGGKNVEECNSDIMAIILSHFPAGTSIHTLVHYAQLKISGEFMMYDWGTLGNLNHYGQKTPPYYNLSRVTPPTALFWGENDFLATPVDVARLSSELPNLTLNYKVDHPEFAHFDFTWAIHANELAYQYVVDYLAGY